MLFTFIRNVKVFLVNSVFNNQKQTEVEFLIQNHQSVLIRLLNDLWNYQTVLTGNEILPSFYSSVIEYLSDILSYIEKYFSKYFNIEENLPQVYYSVISKEFEDKLEKLKINLKEKAAENKLIEVIFSSFPPYKNNQSNVPITYRHLIYLKELINELHEITQPKKDEDWNKVIQHHLVYLNYNHPAFVNLVIDNLTIHTNSQESLQEKILKLRFYKKEVNQISARPEAALYKDILPAKEQIILWIEEEIHYLQNEGVMLKQLKAEDQTSDSAFKINTSLSIPQLAYLIRLLVENKTITNINQTQILKFFALNFTSLKRENMSYDHLRSQYYKMELPAIESIKSLLLSLVNLSRKIK